MNKLHCEFLNVIGTVYIVTECTHIGEFIPLVPKTLTDISVSIAQLITFEHEVRISCISSVQSFSLLSTLNVTLNYICKMAALYTCALNSVFFLFLTDLHAYFIVVCKFMFVQNCVQFHTTRFISSESIYTMFNGKCWGYEYQCVLLVWNKKNT